MTAPMTPHGSHPYPDPAGGKDTSPFGGDPARPDVAGEVRTGALVTIGVALGGVVLGLLWLWLSPKVPLISDGKAVYLKDSEGEQPIGGDGSFALLGLGLGAVSAALVFWRCRKGGIAVVVGLAVGGVAASLIAWRLGLFLGPTDDVVARAKEVGAGKVFDAPLKLRAKAALLAWPMAAMIVHLALTAAFGPRDPRPAAPQWGKGGWGQPVPVPPGQYPQPPADPFAPPADQPHQQPPRQ